MRAADLRKLRDNLRSDFVQFVCFHLELEGHKVGQINKDMAAYLAKPSRIKLLLAARGFAKSTLLIYYAAWRLLRVPSTKVHFISHADHQAVSLAERLLTFLRSSPVMQPYAPGKGISKSNYQIKYGSEERDKSVSVSGIKGSRTGVRSDLIIADDIETKENAATAALREDLLNSMGELTKLLHEPLRLLRVRFTPEEWAAVEPQLKEAPEQTQIVYLGTYQTTESIYIVPEKIEDGGHPLKLAEIAKFPALKPDGTSAFPEKYSTEDLDFKKATDSTQNWLLHFMLDCTTVDSSVNPVKWDRLAQYLMTPRQLACYIDPTGSSQRTKQWDEFACLFGGPCEGKLYVDDIRGWKSEDSFVSYGKVVDLCVAKNVSMIYIEAQQPTEVNVLKRVIADRKATIRVEPFSIGNANKELRVTETLEVALNNQAVVFRPATAPGRMDGVLDDPRTRDQLKRMRTHELPEPNDRLDILASFIMQGGNRISAPYKFAGYRMTGS